MALLAQTFRRAGILLFPLPRLDIKPGALLDARLQLFDDLLRHPVWSSPPSITQGTPARLLLDAVSRGFGVEAGVELGIPTTASIQALLQADRQATLSIRGLTLRQVEQDGHAVLPADWMAVLDKLSGTHPGLKKRRVGHPRPRALDIVTATVHAEAVEFEAQGSGRAAIDAALAIDVQAGLKVRWTASRRLSWDTQEIPLGFIPLRYGWNPRTKRFEGTAV